LEQDNTPINWQSQDKLHISKLLSGGAAYPVIWVRADKQILYANDAACRFLEQSPQQLLSMTLQDLNLESLIEVWSKYWIQLQQQGSLYFEGSYQTQKGQKCLLEINITYMGHKNAECCCILLRNICQPQSDKTNNNLNHSIQNLAFESRNTEQQSVTIPLCTEAMSIADTKLRVSSHAQLRAVFEFIEANYHQSITLCDVAQFVGYSSAYLTDLVRRCTGKPVNHWIVERRMQAARNLLLETNHSITHIAEAVGYQYEGHFFRQFRQYHKTTPQAWRKEQHQEIQAPQNFLHKIVGEMNFYK
ncbi:helix-turn-helix domain-containing protein, partial [Nostoc sp. NIES-2111]